MKRILRIIFNGLTLLSLLLCITTLVFWARSYQNSDLARVRVGKASPVKFSTTGQAEAWERTGKAKGWYGMVSVKYVSVASWRGKCHVLWNLDRDIAITAKWVPKRFIYTSDPSGRFLLNGNPLANSGIGNAMEWRHWSLEYDWMQFGALVYYRWAIPWWILSFLSLILPLGFLRMSYMKRHRQNVFGCRNCGYDLRATPDRCPECGTVPEKVKA